MKDSEVVAAFCDWLEAISGVNVIQAYQDKARPALPYIVVNLTGTASVREHEQRVVYTELETENTEGQLEVRAAPRIETEWRLSLQAFAKNRISAAGKALASPTPANPTDVLRPVRAAAVLPQKNEPLMPGLVIHEVSQVRFVPEFVNAVWEPRAQMDVFLRGMVEDGFVIDTIETYSVEVDRA